MTKHQLINIVAKKVRLPKKATNEAIEIFIEEIINALAKGNKVVLSGFGTLYVSKVKNKDVVPFGDESKRQTIKSHRVVNFRVGKPLKKKIW